MRTCLAFLTKSHSPRSRAPLVPGLRLGTHCLRGSASLFPPSRSSPCLPPAIDSTKIRRDAIFHFYCFSAHYFRRLQMSRSRYRFGDEDFPHFMTNTIVAWLPVFSQPDLANIVLDSWRFLQRERRLSFLRGSSSRITCTGSTPDRS